MKNLFICFLFVYLFFNPSSQKLFGKGRNISINIAERAVLNALTYGLPTTTRPFAAALKSTTGELVCSATNIHQNWALTSAQCVDGREEENLKLELRLYRDGRKSEKIIIMKSILKIITHEQFRNHPAYQNDIAVLEFEQIASYMLEKYPGMIIPLCHQRRSILDPGKQPLGFTGFGLTFRIYFSFPEYPQEATFHESNFASLDPFNLEFCRDENVCVDTEREPPSNICHFDDGGPLYAVEFCDGALRAKCLYGIGSYFKNTSEPITPTPTICNDGSIFTSTVYFRDWIESIVSTLASGSRN